MRATAGCVRDLSTELFMNAFKGLVVAAAVALATAAFAAGNDYAEAAKKIDAAMASGKHAASTTDEVRKLRAESERMMKAGKEAEAMQLLEKAKKLLEGK
jgi:hypothetical protein